MEKGPEQGVCNATATPEKSKDPPEKAVLPGWEDSMTQKDGTSQQSHLESSRGIQSMFSRDWFCGIDAAIITQIDH